MDLCMFYLEYQPKLLYLLLVNLLWVNYYQLIYYEFKSETEKLGTNILLKD